MIHERCCVCAAMEIHVRASGLVSTARGAEGALKMKLFTTVAALCLGAVLVGCSSTSSQSASAGAMGEGKACCKDSAACKDKDGVSAGAVGEGKSGCCHSKDAAASPGAVGAEKSSCTKTCPASKDAVAPGAVGAEKPGCTKVCPASKEAVSPGAVGAETKSGCCSKGAK
jgi:hypothetical protein